MEEVQQHKNNPGSLWKIINQAIPSQGQDKLSYAKDPKTVANEFNQFFSSIGSKTIHMSSEDRFSFKTVTGEEVRRVISSLLLNKSPRPDKITSRILKDCLAVILRPLTNIINCSLTCTCTFPTAWKVAEVIPIEKDGDYKVASNNRPISLLAITFNVCEKIVLEQFSFTLQVKTCSLLSI